MLDLYASSILLGKKERALTMGRQRGKISVYLLFDFDVGEKIMSVLPITLMVLIALALWGIVICLKGVMTIVENIVAVGITLVSIPFLVFGAFFLLAIPVSIIDPAVHFWEIVKQVLSVFLQFTGIFMVYAILFGLAGLVVKLLVKPIIDLVKKIVEFLSKTVSGWFRDGFLSVVRGLKSFVALKNMPAQEGNVPAFIWILQFVVYLPIYILGLVYYACFKLFDLVKKNRFMIVLLFFIILNLLSVNDDDSYNCLVLFKMFNKDAWVEVLQNNPVIGVSVLDPSSNASIVSRTIMFVFWTAVSYVLPSVLLGFGFSAFANEMSEFLPFEEIEDSFQEVFTSLNSKTRTLYLVKKDKLYAGYVLSFLCYIVIAILLFGICTMVKYFALVS